MAEPAGNPSVAAPAAAAPPEAVVKDRGAGARFVDAFLVRREASILLVEIALIVYFQASSDQFLTETNIRTLAQFVPVSA